MTTALFENLDWYEKDVDSIGRLAARLFGYPDPNEPDYIFAPPSDAEKRHAQTHFCVGHWARVKEMAGCKLCEKGDAE